MLERCLASVGLFSSVKKTLSYHGNDYQMVSVIHIIGMVTAVVTLCFGTLDLFFFFFFFYKISKSSLLSFLSMPRDPRPESRSLVSWWACPNLQ